MALVYRVVPNFKAELSYNEFFNYQAGYLTLPLFGGQLLFNINQTRGCYDLVSNTFTYKDEISKHFFYFPYNAVSVAERELGKDYTEVDEQGVHRRNPNFKPSFAILEYDIPNQLLIQNLGFGNYEHYRARFFPECKGTYDLPPLPEFKITQSDFEKYTTPISKDEDAALTTKIINHLHLTEQQYNNCLIPLEQRKCFEKAEDWYVYATKDFLTGNHWIIKKESFNKGEEFSNLEMLPNNLNNQNKLNQYIYYNKNYIEILENLGISTKEKYVNFIAFSLYNGNVGPIPKAKEYVKKLI